MGKHEIGPDGVSYSVMRELEKDEVDIRHRLFIIRHKCYHFMLRNGHHISATVAIHVVSLYVLQHMLPYIPVNAGH